MKLLACFLVFLTTFALMVSAAPSFALAFDSSNEYGTATTLTLTLGGTDLADATQVTFTLAQVGLYNAVAETCPDFDFAVVSPSEFTLTSKDGSKSAGVTCTIQALTSYFTVEPTVSVADNVDGDVTASFSTPPTITLPAALGFSMLPVYDGVAQSSIVKQTVAYANAGVEFVIPPINADTVVSELTLASAVFTQADGDYDCMASAVKVATVALGGSGTTITFTPTNTVGSKMADDVTCTVADLTIKANPVVTVAGFKISEVALATEDVTDSANVKVFEVKEASVACVVTSYGVNVQSSVSCTVPATSHRADDFVYTMTSEEDLLDKVTLSDASNTNAVVDTTAKTVTVTKGSTAVSFGFKVTIDTLTPVPSAFTLKLTSPTVTPVVSLPLSVADVVVTMPFSSTTVMKGSTTSVTLSVNNFRSAAASNTVTITTPWENIGATLGACPDFTVTSANNVVTLTASAAVTADISCVLQLQISKKLAVETPIKVSVNNLNVALAAPLAYPEIIVASGTVTNAGFVGEKSTVSVDLATAALTTSAPFTIEIVGLAAASVSEVDAKCKNGGTDIANVAYSAGVFTLTVIQNQSDLKCSFDLKNDAVFASTNMKITIHSVIATITANFNIAQRTLALTSDDSPFTMGSPRVYTATFTNVPVAAAGDQLTYVVDSASDYAFVASTADVSCVDGASTVANVAISKYEFVFKFQAASTGTLACKFTATPYGPPPTASQKGSVTFGALTVTVTAIPAYVAPAYYPTITTEAITTPNAAGTKFTVASAYPQDTKLTLDGFESAAAKTVENADVKVVYELTKTTVTIKTAAITSFSVDVTKKSAPYKLFVDDSLHSLNDADNYLVARLNFDGSILRYKATSVEFLVTGYALASSDVVTFDTPWPTFTATAATCPKFAVAVVGSKVQLTANAVVAAADEARCTFDITVPAVAVATTKPNSISIKATSADFAFPAIADAFVNLKSTSVVGYAGSVELSSLGLNIAANQVVTATVSVAAGAITAVGAKCTESGVDVATVVYAEQAGSKGVFTFTVIQATSALKCSFAVTTTAAVSIVAADFMVDVTALNAVPVDFKSAVNIPTATFALVNAADTVGSAIDFKLTLVNPVYAKADNGVITAPAAVKFLVDAAAKCKNGATEVASVSAVDNVLTLAWIADPSPAVECTFTATPYGTASSAASTFKIGSTTYAVSASPVFAVPAYYPTFTTSFKLVASNYHGNYLTFESSVDIPADTVFDIEVPQTEASTVPSEAYDITYALDKTTVKLNVVTRKFTIGVTKTFGSYKVKVGSVLLNVFEGITYPAAAAVFTASDFTKFTTLVSSSFVFKATNLDLAASDKLTVEHGAASSVASVSDVTCNTGFTGAFSGSAFTITADAATTAEAVCTVKTQYSAALDSATDLVVKLNGEVFALTTVPSIPAVPATPMIVSVSSEAAVFVNEAATVKVKFTGIDFSKTYSFDDIEYTVDAANIQCTGGNMAFYPGPQFTFTATAGTLERDAIVECSGIIMTFTQPYVFDKWSMSSNEVSAFVVRNAKTGPQIDVAVVDVGGVSKYKLTLAYASAQPLVFSTNIVAPFKYTRVECVKDSVVYGVMVTGDEESTYTPTLPAPLGCSFTLDVFNGPIGAPVALTMTQGDLKSAALLPVIARPAITNGWIGYNIHTMFSGTTETVKYAFTKNAADVVSETNSFDAQGKPTTHTCTKTDMAMECTSDANTKILAISLIDDTATVSVTITAADFNEVLNVVLPSNVALTTVFTGVNNPDVTDATYVVPRTEQSMVVNVIKPTVTTNAIVDFQVYEANFRGIVGCSMVNPTDFKTTIKTINIAKTTGQVVSIPVTLVAGTNVAVKCIFITSITGYTTPSITSAVYVDSHKIVSNSESCNLVKRQTIDVFSRTITFNRKTTMSVIELAALETNYFNAISAGFVDLTQTQVKVLSQALTSTNPALYTTLATAAADQVLDVKIAVANDDMSVDYATVTGSAAVKTALTTAGYNTASVSTMTATTAHNDCLDGSVCGGDCLPCQNGKSCAEAADCVSEYCGNFVCSNAPSGNSGGGGKGSASAVSLVSVFFVALVSMVYLV